MHSVPQLQNEQNTGGKRTKSIALKCAAAFICLLLILSAGVFMKYQQTLSAGGIATSGLEPVKTARHIGGGQVQDIERIARGTDKQASKPSIWPTRGEVTSNFGWRNSPWGDGNEFHQGLDIANSLDTPIVATADGEVVQSGLAGGYGNLVQIDHGNGIATVYGHNSRLAVSVGQSVKKGQVIAYLGSTGRSTGPHVHYEIRVNGTAVDPIGYMVMY